MRVAPFVLILAILLTTVRSADAGTPFDDVVGLKWCFDTDKPFYQVMTTETKQEMKVLGTNVLQNGKQTYYYSWKLVKYDGKEKHWIVKQKIEAVKLHMEIGGNSVEFDSTKGAQPGNPLSVFGALAGAEFDVTLDADLHVWKLEGGKQLRAKINQTDPNITVILAQVVGEAALRNRIEQSLPVIPRQPTVKDRAWTREMVLREPFGKFRVMKKYSVVKRDAGLEKMRIDPTLESLPPDTGMDGTLPYTIKKFALKSSEGEGTLDFDVKDGRIARSETTIKLKGTLAIELNGTTTAAELDQTEKVSVKTSRTNPLKK